MKIDLLDVVLHENKTCEYEVSLEAEEINVNGTDCKVVAAPVFILTAANRADVRVDIKADSTVKLSVPCDRCLEPVEITVHIDIDEQIPIENGSLAGEKPYFIGANTMDVESAIMDSIFSNYPYKVLCSEDCKGLCMKCGQNLNIKDCGCDRFVPDPRMAAFLDF